ncbi:MAG: PEP-CTERM sorting domain-containing protein [Nitrospinota bacterium]
MKSLWVYSILAMSLLFGGMSKEVKAASYSDLWGTPDILKNGNEYSNISTGWTHMGTSVFTPWDNTWVEFSANLTMGNWNIGLDAKNVYGSLNNGSLYTHFEMYNNLTNSIISIPASNDDVNHGFINANLSAGSYTVRYTWLNDTALAPNDANIKIVDAFFDKTVPPTVTDRPTVPEPSGLLLLGTGLAGACFYRRRKVMAE